MTQNSKCFLVISFLFLTAISVSQTISIDEDKRDLKGIYRKIFFKKDTLKNKPDKKVAFSLLPVSNDGNTQGGVVISFFSTFYLSKDHENTTVSQISFTPTVNINSQFVFPVYSNLYTKNNTYHLIGDYRYMIYPQPTFGLGEHYTLQQQSVLDYKQVRFYQFVSRKVIGFLHLGLGVQMDSYQDISEESTSNIPTDFYTYMKGDFANRKSSGLTLQTIYDSRKNTYSPKQGWYVEADYRVNQKFFGGDTRWDSFYFDARKYISISATQNKVLATRLFYWTTFSGRPHYLDLPSIGWDRYGTTGRGFTRNRFRSNALLFLETEYRTDITKDGFLGLVFFASATAITKLDKHSFVNCAPAIGTGLRMKWDKKRDNNIIADFGFSRNDWSFSLGVSERF